MRGRFSQQTGCGGREVPALEPVRGLVPPTRWPSVTGRSHSLQPFRVPGAHAYRHASGVGREPAESSTRLPAFPHPPRGRYSHLGTLGRGRVLEAARGRESPSEAAYGNRLGKAFPEVPS